MNEPQAQNPLAAQQQANFNDIDSFLANAPAKEKKAIVGKVHESQDLDQYLSDVPAPPGQMSGGKAALTGANRGFEDMLYGTMQLASELSDSLFNSKDIPFAGIGGIPYAAANAIKNVTGAKDLNKSAEAVRVFREKVSANSAYVTSEKEFSNAMEAHPYAAGGGYLVGSTVAAAPTGFIGGGLTAGYKAGTQGALMGAMMWDSSDSLTDSIFDGIASFVGAGVIGWAANKIAVTYQGYKAGKAASSAFIDDVTTGLKNKTGVDSISTNVDDIVANVNNKFNEFRTEKNNLFKLRNDAANAAGIVVKTDSVNAVINSFKKAISENPQSAEKVILKDIQGMSSTNGYSLERAYTLTGKLGDDAFSARVTDPNKARILSQAKTALEQDIEKAIAGSSALDVKALHETAMNFYTQKYLPVKTVARSKALEAVTETGLLDTLVNSVGKSRTMQSGVDLMGNDIKKQILAAQIDSAKEVAGNAKNLLTGETDIAQYAKALGKRLAQNPLFTSQANDLRAAGTALMHYSQVVGKTGSGLAAGLGTATASAVLASTGSVTAATAAGTAATSATKMSTFQAYAALGKAIQTPAIQALLKQSDNVIRNGAAPAVQDVVLTKTGRALQMLVRQTMPLLGAIGGVSVSRTVQQEQKRSNDLAMADSVGGVRG
jgi:hypothetical protein